LQHRPLDRADAGDKVDRHLVAGEAAGEGIVVRGLVVAQQQFEGVRVFPGAAGGDLGGMAGAGCAAGDRPRRRAG